MVRHVITTIVIKMTAYTYIEKGHFSRIEDAYKLFENKEDGLIKVEIDNRY